MKKYILINFGYNPWSDFWKRNQTIFYFLSKENYIEKSYFVNAPVFLSDLIKHPVKELSQPKVNNWKAVFDNRPKHFTGKVITSLVYPFYFKNQKIKDLNELLVAKAFKDVDPAKAIVVVNRGDTFTRQMVEKCFPRPAMKVFDWSDDFEQFSNNAQSRADIRKNVEAHLSSADVVLCVNENLWERACQFNQNSYVVKNATNFFTFGDRPEPTGVNLKSGRPVVGYMGWINESRLDGDLIRYLAHQRPEWDFVFIGPRSHADALTTLRHNCDNVKLVAPVSYEQIPGVLAQFDVCILPNLLNEHTDGNDPIKLFDYLASGKPVVSTNTSGAGYLRDHIGIAHDREEFLLLVENAIDSPGDELARIECGRLHSWSNRFLEVDHLITGALAGYEI